MLGQYAYCTYRFYHRTLIGALRSVVLLFARKAVDLIDKMAAVRRKLESAPIDIPVRFEVRLASITDAARFAICVVGSCENLGMWNQSNGLKLVHIGNGLWTAECNVRRLFEMHFLIVKWMFLKWHFCSAAA